MTKIYSRSRAEQELVHALTRQIGYTTGAFSIRRMAGLAECFQKASQYQFELTKALSSTREGGEELSDKYATEILNFSAELGIVTKVLGASVPRLSKYIVTDAGVALRAARAPEIADPDLENLVLNHLILENDADAYLSVLSLLDSNPNATSEELAVGFQGEVQSMRSCRLAWLNRAFPNSAIRSRIVKGTPKHIHWISIDRLNRISAEVPGKDFGRHHAAPRKSWAAELGHFDQNRAVVGDSGKSILKIAQWPGLGGKGWIAPTPECLTFLRCEEAGILRGAASPTIELLRPAAAEPDSLNEFVELAARFLKSSFPYLRLIHARQAPTAALRYRLLLEEQRRNCRLDFEKILTAVAKGFAGEISFYSSRSSSFAYYQLRTINA